MTFTQLFVLESVVCVIEMQFVLRYYTSVYGIARHITAKASAWEDYPRH